MTLLGRVETNFRKAAEDLVMDCRGLLLLQEECLLFVNAFEFVAIWGLGLGVDFPSILITKGKEAEKAKGRWRRWEWGEDARGRQQSLSPSLGDDVKFPNLALYIVSFNRVKIIKGHGKQTKVLCENSVAFLKQFPNYSVF